MKKQGWHEKIDPKEPKYTWEVFTAKGGERRIRCSACGQVYQIQDGTAVYSLPVGCAKCRTRLMGFKKVEK